jgi:hypothetical protein
MERLEEARAIMAHLPLSQGCGAQPASRDQPSPSAFRPTELIPTRSANGRCGAIPAARLAGAPHLRCGETTQNRQRPSLRNNSNYICLIVADFWRHYD